MSRFRIRIAVSRGRKEIDLGKLSGLMTEIDTFLRVLGEDAGLGEEANDWQASKFKDGSLLSEVSCGEVEFEAAFDRCESIARALFSGDPAAVRKAKVRPETCLQYERLAKRTRAGIPLEFGVFKSEKANRPKWFSVSSESATEIAKTVEQHIEYHGTLQGIVHSWFKESDEPHFVLRDLGRNDLVKCFYKTKLYPQVVAALKSKDSVIFVKGLVRANRLGREYESVNVEKVTVAPAFSDSDYDSFIGSAPDLTGSETSSEFIDRIRGDE